MIHLICDSAQFWDSAEPSERICDCDSHNFNVGVGFAFYEDEKAVQWIYVGARCVNCGFLGCFVGWKVGYSPSLQLLDQV